ncbi:hypothetical protein GCM10022248_36500 [Nonomuraea soli]
MGRFPAQLCAGLVGMAVIVAPGAVYAGEWGSADLSVQLSSHPGIAQPGQPILYRVRVKNAGPGDAVLPVLKVTLPRDVDIVGVNVATCRPGRTAHEVTCPSSSDVLAGGTGEVQISGVVRPGAIGPLRAVASLTSEVSDDNEADNTHMTFTRVDEGADLQVRLRSAGSHQLSAVVRNRGPRAVRDALLYFRTGASRLISAQGARCRPRPGHVLCRLRTVGSGKRLRLRLALGGRRRPVVASVYSTVLGDRRPANNVSRVMLRP